MRDVALLGGSFNPPHVGHLMAALYLRSVVGCDEVWLVPAFNHPFGKALAPFDDRVAMCQAMGGDLGPWFHVCLAEAEVGGEGRTVELLEHLTPRYPDIAFRWIIGSDILAELPQWKSWDRVQQLAKVTVLYRAGHPAPDALGPPLAQVSSTDIRRELEAGRVPEALLPRGVVAVLRAKRLYGL